MAGITGNILFKKFANFSLIRASWLKGSSQSMYVSKNQMKIGGGSIPKMTVEETTFLCKSAGHLSLYFINRYGFFDEFETSANQVAL